MKRSIQFLLAVAAALTLAACSTTKPADTSTDSSVNSSSSDTEAEALARQRAAAEAERQRIANLLNSTTIYFDYDQDTIRGEFVEMLEVHAKHMQATGKQVVLEGHADERGTPEYNLALGERRAKAVEQMLRTYGVSVEQTEVISFGEESPASLGHSEEDFQLNRRVELKYQ
ncbi:MAG: OmpA family protein [Kangiellaceae bacterium]|nr:OmpA family protein [Kangiellaceae bacterium]